MLVQASLTLNGQLVNLTQDPCFLAFLLRPVPYPSPPPKPSPSDFKSGTWDVDGRIQRIGLLIGAPNGVVYSPGDYDCWARFTHGPFVITRGPLDVLTITG